MDLAVINANLTPLQRAQQGELDAVLMYNKLAEVVSDSDAAVFRKLAAEEGTHAAFFHQNTQQVLKPKKTKSILIHMLYRIIGRKKTYQLIADKEYCRGEL